MKLVYFIEIGFKEFCKYNHQYCFCRYYRQLNGRLESKVKRDLIAHLVMYPDFNISKTDSLAKRYVANSGKDTVTRKWLFDFDSDDKELLDKFEKDLKRYYTGDYSVYKTVNGYHIVTENGFKEVRRIQRNRRVYLSNNQSRNT